MKLSKKYLLTLQEVADLTQQELACIVTTFEQVMVGPFIPLLVYKSTERNFLHSLLEESEIVPMLPEEKFFQEDQLGFSLLLIEDNPSFKGISPSSQRERISERARGLTLIEGVWFCLAFPESLKGQSIDLISSQYSMECIPTLYTWQGKKRLSAICPDVSDMMCRAPIVRMITHLTRKDLSNANILMGKIRRLYGANLKSITLQTFALSINSD